MSHSSIWLVHAHDVRLVLVAAFVCSLSALTVFTILEHARGAAKRSIAWVALAGTVSGVGIWATHFIAMLSYDPGVRAGYDIPLTVLSAVAGIGFTAFGWAVALRGARLMRVFFSGVLIAAGISTLHYTGMAAVRLPGKIVWDHSLVAVSVLACFLLSVWAVREHGRRAAVIPWRPALILVIAICSLHFVAMGAVSVSPHHNVALPKTLLDRNGLVALVLAGSLLIVAVGFLVVLFDRVTEREKAAAKIAHLAYHDALTGLANRSVVEHQLHRDVEQAHSTGQSLAVICIDLDGFKAVNDTHGHAAGDALLAQVAARLQSAIRGDDLVARIGGDEFVVVQRGGSQPADSGAVAQRVISALNEPFIVWGAAVKISASVGVSIFPKDAATADELTKKADAALYLAKAAGKGMARFYDHSMEKSLQVRQALGLGLADAIRNDEFTLLYQPILNLATGSIRGFEALIRWEHRELGTIDPHLFIGIAEERAFINDIGMWVLKKACTDAASWDDPLMVAVNFSPVQFLSEDLAKCVATVLTETGLDPRRLKIEVTENVLLSQPEQALCIFNELKALGTRISLDDFGTGYSSLSYFRVFPFDQVKIDRSFVADLDGYSSKEIIRSIIELSRSLGISVVAEGVETAAQLETLRQLGCELVQGYLISPPQPPEHFASVMFRRRKNLRAA